MPGLFDSIGFTKLKSLRFEDYGESPLIVNDINNPKDINKSILTSSITDTIRISKFMSSTKGALFIAKQVSTQLMNPKTKSGIGIFGLSDNRIYNLGINTLSQIPLVGIGSHIQRHGVLPNGTPTNLKYEVLAKKTSNVEKYYSKFIENSSTSSKKSRIFNIISKVGNIINNGSIESILENNIIDEYIGGPNSLGGIGTTKIKRYDNTNEYSTNPNQLNILRDEYNNRIQNSDINQLYIDSKAIPTGDNTIHNHILDNNGIENENLLPKPNNYQLNPFGNRDFKFSQNIIKVDGSNIIFPEEKPVNKSLENFIDDKDLKKDKLIDALNNEVLNKFKIFKIDRTNPYSKPVFNSDYQISYGNYYGEIYRASGNWKELNRENRIGSGRTDKINLTPLFNSDSPLPDNINIGGKIIKMRDLIKFRIEAIDNDNPNDSIWMIFRSYLKGITDSHSPQWNSVNYAGRGEEFYIYNKTKRQISFSFQVAALSSKEMMPMYQKLNYLASTIYPDYTDKGLMRGNFHKFTIGNYIYRQPCIIDSLTYTISNETPWEISMTEPENGENDINLYELPHIIDVQMTITPIHNFLPQKSPLLPFIYEEITRKNPWKQDLIDFDESPELPANILKNKDININKVLLKR